MSFNKSIIYNKHTRRLTTKAKSKWNKYSKENFYFILQSTNYFIQGGLQSFEFGGMEQGSVVEGGQFDSRTL